MENGVLVVVAALVLVYVLRRRQNRRSVAASAVGGRQERGFFSAPRRHRFFDYERVIVTDERGTTEVDVVVVGNSGVFVIEMKNFNAWIFGNEDDEKWTASYANKSTHQFQNPLRQNFRHVKALQARLGLPLEMFQSIVAFTGDCELKTPMPSNVIVGNYRSLIEGAGEIRLTDREVSNVCRVLDELESASTDDALSTHVAELKARYSSESICPRCGAALVRRRARTAAADDPGFLGCQAYPRCRYIRRLVEQPGT